MRQMTQTFARLERKDVRVPADVPAAKADMYISNLLEMTRSTGKLMLFAGDQKVEHLNDDFYGTSDMGPIPADDGRLSIGRPLYDTFQTCLNVLHGDLGYVPLFHASVDSHSGGHQGA